MIEIAIGPSPDPNLALHEVSAGSAFGPSFPAGLAVLSNHSDRAIAGIQTIWTVTGKIRPPRRSVSNCDGFMQPGNRQPVLAPGASMLLGPMIFVAGTMAPRIGVDFDGAIGRYARELEQAAAVQASVDAVVFADGEVAGPGAAEYTAEIRARSEAAASVVRMANSAAASGRALGDALNELIEGRRVQRNAASRDYISLWVRRFASKLLRTNGADAWLAHLASFQEPPALWRKVF